MFVRKLHPFGKSPSRPSPRTRRAKALSGAGRRPRIERLEDRTLLSAANQALVAHMYQDLLQRPADAGGLGNWTAALDQGVSPAQVALTLAQSPEGRALQVQSLYQQFLHRAADAAGLDGFAQALAAGQTLEQVAAAIAASPEYYQNQGGTDTGFLNALYQDALNRPIDASGAVSLGQALVGGKTRARVAESIFASAELQQDAVQHDYQYFLHRAADVSGLANWTGAIQHGMRDEQIAAAIVGSSEYAQNAQSAGGSLQQTLLPDGGVGLPVIVTNTPSQPVPITGTVKAQQSGAWTVGISGTANVNVASSVSNPVFVRDVNNAEQPFEIEIQPVRGAYSKFTVPSGKRLVIENVSGLLDVEPSGSGAYLVLYTPGSSIYSIYIPMTAVFSFSAGSLSETTLVANEQVKRYVEPGTVFVGAFSNATSFLNADITISGYLVNVP
jgi:hypothetical protein